MNDNHDSIETTSIEEDDQRRRILIYALVGVVIVGCLALFLLSFFWFRPGQASPFSQLFPSPTSTPRPTRTPEPSQTPRADLTATQQAWVKPAQSPSLADVAEASTAFQSGTVYLETFASVKPEIPEINQPGDLYLYDIQLPGSDQFPVAWSYGWCASLEEILDDNFKYIQLDFTINGSPVSLDHFAILQEANPDGSACRQYAALVDTWPAGQHHLETHVTFTQDIHDGWNLFPAGTHTLKYIVTVGQ